MYEERIFEAIIAENSSNLLKNINIRIQEAQRILGKKNSGILTETHHSQTIERLR